MSNNLKVKVILGNDIRRWRYNKSDNIQQLSSLKEFVSSSFNINDFWLQYEDDEGDRLTLSSNNDFEDAFTCAQEEDRKSLKIYVIQGSINNAQRMRASSIGSNIPNNGAPQSPQNGPCHPDPECDANKCFEMYVFYYVLKSMYILYILCILCHSMNLNHGLLYIIYITHYINHKS